MTGGIPPQRPDQSVAPPPMVVAPGGASGIFRGRLVIVNGQVPPSGGIFLYDNTGELVGYWVTVAGTDPLKGSSINPGLVVQNATNALESVNIQEGSITLAKTSGLFVTPEIIITDATQSAPFGNMSIDSINGIVMDTWHTIPLAAGWSTIGGQPVPSYRLLPDGNVQIAGNVTHTSFSTNIQLNSSALPAAYQPVSNFLVSPGVTGDAGIQVNSSGIINAELGTLASATNCRFNGIYPLNL